MPTPFMHMAVAHRLSQDTQVPATIRKDVEKAWGAFLLGNIAADARVSSGLQRADTHFFEYQEIIDPPATLTMLSRHPELRHGKVSAADQAAFVGGYLAHLVMDEVWCMDMLYPHFGREWSDSRTRFLMLHMLLCYLDERDYHTLPKSDYVPLHDAVPHHWLPFIGDPDLAVWRDLIAEQLAPEHDSRTYEILSKRILMPADEMAAFVHNEQRMNESLWQNVTPEIVAGVERTMYERARQVLIDYYDERI